MGTRLIISKGDRFGKLTILKEIEKRGQYRMFRCGCSCGNIIETKLILLTQGHTKSCGCIVKNGEHKKTHGMNGTRIYRIWQNMKARCKYEYVDQYKNYGGRGIAYEERWENFENFYHDMGGLYNSHVQKYGETQTTIDRIDVNGNYCKNNCKWSTRKEQNNNTRKTNYKPVIRMDLDGNFLEEYESIKCAARNTTAFEANIIKACKGEYSQTAGFKWKYK